MSGISYSDFDALPDVLGVDRFSILISPAVNSGLNAILAIRCQQIAVPEQMFEVMTVAVQGMEFNFRGRRTYDKSIAATFIETSDSAVSTGMRTWMEQIGGSESQNGVNKSGYATVGTLGVLDQSGNTAIAFTVQNMWPSQLPSVQLDGGQGSSPYLAQAVFTYDRYQQVGVAAN